jgi:hypothetical protein
MNESKNSQALLNYAGLLYEAYMSESMRSSPYIQRTPWASYVCDPLNKAGTKCWVAVARVAIKLENDAREGLL